MVLGAAILSTSFLFLLRRLYSSSSSPAASHPGRRPHGEAEEELEENLRRTVTRLGALLRDAERRESEGGELSALWLRELRDLARDAEDVVDELEYEDLRRQAEAAAAELAKGGASGSSFSSSSSPPNSPRTCEFRGEMSRRIDGIWGRLEEISKDMKHLDISWMLDDVGQDDRQAAEFRRRMKGTGSILADPEVFGRDEVKNKLMGLLLSRIGDDAASAAAPSTSEVHHSGLSVVSIVGMGGLGKTTIAQWVYSSKEVQEHFHLRMWVWVSHNFDPKRVTKQILEHVVGPQSGLKGIDDLDVLQENLVKGLRGKRFLLVLDDVWEEDRSKWREFSAPLAHGGKSSKVIVTTRSARVADMVQSVKIEELEGLPFDDCWSVFRKHAFADASSGRHPNMESIGKALVKKLNGLPLAAATIGGLLRFEFEERQWMDVLQSELWELEDGGDGIFPALKVSYKYLPPHLKQCFLYCSVLLKGYKCEVLELVQQWVAQGYVRPQGSIPAEDVGRDYFDELIGRSLIQFVGGKFVVHDLLYDLGQLTLQHDCYQIGPDQVQAIPEDAHSKLHLRLVCEGSLGGELQVLHKFRSLRTLSFWFSKPTVIQIPLNLFHTIECLRVLGLRHSSIDSLPDSIGNLKHLRYLDLRRTKIRCLPDSICALYMLQTLKLKGCDELTVLPDGMSNMINLHYLEAKCELVTKISNLGKLSHLQSLEVFSVSEEIGNRIGGLQNMNELRGKLCIRNLQRVGAKEDAIETALMNKQYIEILEMEWAGDRELNKIDHHLEESVIEGLQPPPCLKELIIKCYAGINLPSWMSNSSISSLEFINIHRCIDLNCLPAGLLNLILRDVRLNAHPNSLHRLPLQRLVICQILELRELPFLPNTLKELVIESVGLEALPEFYQGSGASAAMSRGIDEDEFDDNRKALLSILKIHGCPCLTTLHEGLLRHHLRHLRVLSIKDCEELVNWPEGEGFQSTLCSLEEELNIVTCPKMEALPEGSKLPTSLKKLTVQDCPWVANESLLSQLHNINCDDINVGHFTSLAFICDNILQHIKSVNWLSIKHIYHSGITTPVVSFCCEKAETFSRDLGANAFSLRVTMAVIMAPPDVDGDDGAAVDDDCSRLLSTCLGGHLWASSLRLLTLDNIPNRALRGFQHHLLRLPSLEKLWTFRCRTPLLETMLCHLTALKELRISDWPELTLSSLVEGIRSVHFLEELHVYKCPKLLMPPSAVMDSSVEDALSSSPPPVSLAPPRMSVRCLGIDDTMLMVRLLVGDNLLSSLRALRIQDPKLTSLTMAAEGLRTLGSSLQFLALVNCPNLRSLPTDLRGLLPNLKVLFIDGCPEIRCLPETGLPASLELLRINECPTLTQRCRPRPWETPEENDWHKITHIPVIGIDRAYVQGSYGRVLELEVKWDFPFMTS